MLTFVAVAAVILGLKFSDRVEPEAEALDTELFPDTPIVVEGAVTVMVAAWESSERSCAKGTSRTEVLSAGTGAVGPEATASRAAAMPMESGPAQVSASSRIHSPTGSRARLSVRSPLMKVQCVKSSTAEVPLQKSAAMAARTDW